MKKIILTFIFLLPLFLFACSSNNESGIKRQLKIDEQKNQELILESEAKAEADKKAKEESEAKAEADKKAKEESEAKAVPTIVGTVNFQVDIQQVTTSSQLGQASIIGPSLIDLKSGGYRLYLQARAGKNDKNNAEGVNILSLISSDGIEWNIEPGIRIKHGTQFDVDSEAGEPGVYLGMDEKYYMAYTGRFMGVNKRGLKQTMHRIVFAVSDDGLTWSKLNKHYSDPENINDFASSADVHLINRQYVIYYTGQRNIIRATSHDGLQWTRKKIAVSIGHDSTMVKYEDTYYMFVIMPKTLLYPRNATTENDILFLLVSDNGIDWSENYYQVIIKDSDGNEVKAQDIQDPGAIVLSDGSLRVFLNNHGGKIIYSIKPTEKLPK